MVWKPVNTTRYRFRVWNSKILKTFQLPLSLSQTSKQWRQVAITSSLRAVMCPTRCDHRMVLNLFPPSWSSAAWARAAPTRSSGIKIYKEDGFKRPKSKPSTKRAPRLSTQIDPPVRAKKRVPWCSDTAIAQSRISAGQPASTPFVPSMNWVVTSKILIARLRKLGHHQDSTDRTCHASDYQRAWHDMYQVRLLTTSPWVAVKAKMNVDLPFLKVAPIVISKLSAYKVEVDRTWVICRHHIEAKKVASIAWTNKFRYGDEFQPICLQ